MDFLPKSHTNDQNVLQEVRDFNTKKIFHGSLMSATKFLMYIQINMEALYKLKGKFI